MHTVSMTLNKKANRFIENTIPQRCELYLLIDQTCLNVSTKIMNISRVRMTDSGA